jgi:hypothetical protein
MLFSKLKEKSNKNENKMEYSSSSFVVAYLNNKKYDMFLEDSYTTRFDQNDQKMKIVVFENKFVSLKIPALHIDTFIHVNDLKYVRRQCFCENPNCKGVQKKVGFFTFYYNEKKYNLIFFDMKTIEDMNLNKENIYTRVSQINNSSENEILDHLKNTFFFEKFKVTVE